MKWRWGKQTIGLIFITVRILQWLSAVIVMGISSYFVARGPRDEHALYWEILSVISVAIFLLVIILSYLLFQNMAKYAWAYYLIFTVDCTFSYLWLTTFIFAAQDYNLHNCKVGTPVGVPCGVKKANESFMFVTFISTLCLSLFEGSPLSPLSTYTFDEEKEQTNGVPSMSEHDHPEEYH